jgi:hypothetical protein
LAPIGADHGALGETARLGIRLVNPFPDLKDRDERHSDNRPGRPHVGDKRSLTVGRDLVVERVQPTSHVVVLSVDLGVGHVLAVDVE